VIQLLSSFGIVLVVILDQLSKRIVENSMNYFQRIDILGKILGFRYVHNRGVAFGMFSGVEGILIASISTTIIIGLLIFGVIFKNRLSKIEQFFFGMIIGGALGNLIDRLRLGYVVDFIELPYWPVFNVADTSIVLGTILLLFLYYRREHSARRTDCNQS